MTRTQKYTREQQQEQVPKFFGKSGFAGVDPKHTKKNGGGRGNWGSLGEEVVDENFNFTNARRRSNSSSFSGHIDHFKTKFDVNEPEPVFEEDIHGPPPKEETAAEVRQQQEEAHDDANNKSEVASVSDQSSSS